VRAVAVGEQRRVGAGEHRVARERTQQLVVAGAGLVGAADDRVDDAQRRVRTEFLIRQSVAGTQRPA